MHVEEVSVILVSLLITCFKAYLFSSMSKLEFETSLLLLVVVVVLLLTAKSHTNRSHVSNIFTCVVIFNQKHICLL